MDGLGEIDGFTLVKVRFPVQLLLQIFMSVFPQEYLHIFLPQLVQDWDHVKLTKHLFPLTQFCDWASPPSSGSHSGCFGRGFTSARRWHRRSLWQHLQAALGELAMQ